MEQVMVTNYLPDDVMAAFRNCNPDNYRDLNLILEVILDCYQIEM
jgi:hypothetical protein